MHRARAALLALVVLVVAGCAPARLVPAPGTVAVPGPGAGAIAEAAGVRVVARTSAWNGIPAGLEFEVIPVLVMIENNGTHAIRVRHDDFALVGAGGRRYTALSPFDIRGTVAVPVEVPYPAAYPRPYPRFHSRWYWDDPFWYPSYYPAFTYIPLPTGDMIQKALPETVAAPGTRITGYVYFPRPRKKDDPQLTFTATLVDANTNHPAGTISIPFVYTD